ncbi:Rmf/CrpP family protein [Aminobacter sp. MDW-2]|uniref:ribosome modulation factor n=1 Tax=Aminobacter sp. MDW-2 TaxID=2666139 RepID=UPI0035303099
MKEHPKRSPEVNSAKTEGLDAYCRGIARDACPYCTQSDIGKAWLRGWDDAAWIDLEESDG